MADDHVLQTKLFNFICGSGGFVDLAILLKPSSPLGSRKTQESAKKWLERRQGPQAGFACVLDRNGEITGVRVDLRKKVCYRYATKGVCRFRGRKKGNCKYWHICKAFVEGKCDEFCELSHDFYSDDNWEIAEDLNLPEDKYSNGAMKKIVSWSLPQVCELYQRNECAWSECPYVHVCAQFVEESSHSNCVLSHGLQDFHNLMILEKYDLVPSSKVINIDFVRCNVLRVYEQKRINPIAVVSSDPARFQTSLQSSQAQRVSGFKPSVPWTPCFPTEWKVFECLCKEYGSSASFQNIAGRKDLFPYGAESAEGWFRETKQGSFLITRGSQGTIAEVSAFSARARICVNYNENGRCHRSECSCLHICRDFLTDSCSNGVTCSLNHHFHNQRDEAFLIRIKLDQFTDQQLQQLVLCSTPRICVEYNNGICNRGDNCNRIHMCCGHIRKCCGDMKECGLDHAEAMDTHHTQVVLERYLLHNVGKHEAKTMILDDKLCLSGKEKAKGHIHKDKPGAYICSGFLIDECKVGMRCPQHHLYKPYHWQYKVLQSDEWKSFFDMDSFTLEKFYCDVNVEAPVNFNPAQSLDLSSLQRAEIRPLVNGYEVKIDVNDMTMTILEKSPPRRVFAGALRRISTMPRLTFPRGAMVTNWTWYWKDNGNVWRRYNEDNSGHIEQAFLNGRLIYRFKTSEHEYNLIFHSTTDMHQINLKLGTKRAVKRRPEKALTNEDMEDLIWAYGDSSRRRKIENRTARYDVPNHWSSMPPSGQYIRVVLATSSEEYKEVEQLFRKSMNDYITIERIERVQNPFMWEKYCRKKQNMRLVARRNSQAVNEKNLFHGTSPDSVEAICKQNFDWRLHGRNASKYGEGSYFAVNASYSHSYAKRDGNMSQFMFLTKVLVGSYTEGHSNYRRPPPKQPLDPASDLFDSCVDNKSSPTIFVVFDTDQFYPEYIIQYFSAPQKSPTGNTTARPQPKPLIIQTSRRSPSTVSKPSLPADNRSSYSAHVVSAQPKAPTRNTTARPQPNPSSFQTTHNNFNTTSRPSLLASSSNSFLAFAASRSGIASTDAKPVSRNLGTAPNANGSTAHGGHSTVSQASSLQPPTTTMSVFPTFQTYPRGILKKHSNSKSGLPLPHGRRDLF